MSSNKEKGAGYDHGYPLAKQDQHRDIARYLCFYNGDTSSRRLELGVKNVLRLAPSEIAEWKKQIRSTIKPDNYLVPVERRLGRVLGDPQACRIVPPGTGVGIELEYVMKRGVGYPEDMPRLELPGVDWTWDGSARVLLNDTPKFLQPCTNEVQIFQRLGYWRRLTQVCEHLKDHGARPYPTCGLHVHLDQRDVGYDEARVRWQRLGAAARGWLHRLCPDYRKLSAYCKLLGRGATRYLAVNWESYHEHKTIEIRYHHATLNPYKVVRWVNLLLWVSRHSGTLRTLSSFLGTEEAPVEMKLWVLWRLARMSDLKDVKGSKLLLSSLLTEDEETVEVELSGMQKLELERICPRPGARSASALARAAQARRNLQGV